MRSFFFSWLFVSQLMICSLQSTLNLNDCQNFALLNCEKMTIADLEALIEQERLNEMQSLALPKLTAEGHYIKSDDARHFHKSKARAHAKAFLTVPLIDLSNRNRIRAQEKSYQSSLFSANNIEQDILYAVNKTYFQLLSDQKLESILQHSIASIQEEFRITEDFYLQGLVHQNDVLVVEVQLAQLKQDAIEAHYQAVLSQASLNRLIGAKIDASLDIQDVNEECVRPDDIQDFILFAKVHHPSLKALRAQIEAGHYQYKAEEAHFYPTVYAFTNYRFSTEHDLPCQHGLDAGIGVQLSLYEGGSTCAKLRRIKKEKSVLEYQYQELETTIELNLRTAHLTMQSALNKIPISLKSIELTKRKLALTKDHFAEGLVAIGDVIGDEGKAITALMNYYDALYTYYQARNDLLYFAGMMNKKDICAYE